MAFYPSGRAVPEERRTSRLTLRPLRATDVELDYDAVMSSAEMLRRWSQGDWPAEGFTLADNLEDLKYHEREHNERTAFTYTVLDPHGTRCLGCVYITPLRPEELPLVSDPDASADVGFWVRTSQIASGLDEHLLACLRDWFRTEWPFHHVLFTVGTKDPHHAALFEAAGLSRRMTHTSSDGQRWVVFG